MKICAKVICFVLGMMLSTVVNGKDFGMSVGLRDTQYAYVGAMWRQTAGLAVEHSIFSEPFSLQYVRIYGRFRRMAGTWVLNYRLIMGEPITAHFIVSVVCLGQDGISCVVLRLMGA